MSLADTRSYSRAIAWMLLSGVMFVCVTGTVRYLGSDLPAVQAAFIRYFFGVVIMAPMLMASLRRNPWPRRFGLHLGRGVVHGVGVMLWFYAMATIPIAEVTAIGFTSPLFVTIGAALFLGERLRARRISAVVLGFVGTLIILRPGVAAIAPGALAQLAAAPLFAISFIITKKLTETESNSVIVAWMSVFVTAVLLVPALWVWQTPTLAELGLLALTAVFASAGHVCMTRAIALGEVTVLQPFSFLQLVWASALGLVAFGEVPDAYTILGGAVIVASATYIAHREAVVRRSRVDD